MNQRLKISVIKNNGWKLLYLLSFLTITASFFYGITYHNRRSIFCFSVAFIFSLIGFLLTMKLSNDKKKVIYQQLFPVYLLFSSFWILSMFSKESVKTYQVNNYIGLGSLLIPLICLTLFFILQKNVKYYFYIPIKYFELTILVVFFIALSIPTFTSWTRLDTNTYYTYLLDGKAWNLSFDTISLFKLGGHQCYGYSLWGLIGVYLTPQSPVGIRIINVLLASISIICFYAILKKLKLTSSRPIIILLTAAFALNPLILGTIYEINLDLPSTCFYIWAVCFLLYKKNILFLFSTLFLVFSKETGILLLAGIGIGWFISHIYSLYRKYQGSFFKFIDWKVIGIFAAPLIILLATIKMGLLWRQDKSSLGISTSNTMDRIGTDAPNTLIKLKEIFILNFSWIITGVIILTFCIYIVQIFRKKRKFQWNFLFDASRGYLLIIISWIFIVAFQFIYITYCHIRYIMPCIIGMIIILAMLVCKAFSKQVQVFSITVIVCLLFIENFYTLDPISKYVCNTINIGDTKIYTTRTYVRSSQNIAQTAETHPELIPYLEMTQSALYNRQFMYFEDAFEKFLKTIQYDENTFIAVAPIYDKVADMTWISLFGKWYTHNLYYNPATYQVVEDTSMDLLNLSIITAPNEIEFDKYTHVYLISFPYNELFDEETYLKQFDFTNTFSIKEKLWRIDVYQLK